MTAVLLESPPLDVYGQMALDEAQLDAGTDDFTLRFFRWAEGSRPSVTFGYFQRYEEVKKSVSPTPAASAATPPNGRGDSSPAMFVRRPTGGGIVHHVDDITFSFTFKSDGTLSPQAMYKNIHRGVHLGLKKMLKLETALWSPPGWRDVPKCETKDACECFVGPEPMDLVTPEDDKKVLGGALRRRAGRVLYQGSLQLQRPISPVPPSVNGRGETDIEVAITRGFEVEWGAVFEKKDAGAGLLSDAAVRRETYLSEDWNRKR